MVPRPPAGPPEGKPFRVVRVSAGNGKLIGVSGLVQVLPRYWDGRRLLRFLTGLAMLALSFTAHVREQAPLPAPPPAAVTAPPPAQAAELATSPAQAAQLPEAAPAAEAAENAPDAQVA